MGVRHGKAARRARHGRAAWLLVTSMAVASFGAAQDQPLAEHERRTRQALEAAQADGDERTAADAAMALGLIRADRGDYADALTLVLPLTEQRQGTAPAGQRRAAAALARIHQLRGDAPRAAAALAVIEAEADVVASAAADLNTGVWPPSLLRGLVELEAGRAGAAVPLLEAALAAHVPAGTSAAVAARVGLSRALVAQGRLDEAARQAADAVAAGRRDGHRLALAEALQVSGVVHRLTGDTLRADAAWQEALAIARELDLPRVIAPVGYALYEGAAARGDHAAGIEYLRLHTEARLRLTGEDATRRVVDVLAAQTDTGGQGRAAPASAVRPTSADDPRADVIRTALLGASLSALVLAAVLWRVGYTRGRRALHYRQELDALKGALTPVSALDGLLTICASCKDVRDEGGEWTRVEAYLAARTDARFTHSVCPTCEQRVLATAEQDALLLASSTGPDTGRLPISERLGGGFDWPPTEEELSRVNQTTSDAEPRGGRWG